VPGPDTYATIGLLLLLLIIPNVASATALGTAAASMAVGTWAEFKAAESATGWNSGRLLGVNGGGTCTVLQYQGKAVWNPVANRYQVVAAAHAGDPGGCPGPSYKFVIYDDATNAWSEGPNPRPGLSDPQHVFDGNAMNPNGTHYVTGSNEPVVHFLTNGSGSWGSWNIPQQSSCFGCAANVYFPDYLGGRLIHVDAEWGTWAVDPSSGASTCIANTDVGQNVGACSGKPTIGPWNTGNAQNPTAVYSPLCRCVMIGTDRGGWWRMASNGTFTSMSTSGGPAGFRTGGSVDSSNSQSFADPVSGKILNLSNRSQGGDGALREFDPTNGTTGTWRTVMTVSQLPAAIQNGGATGIACADVSTYGVVMCVKTDGQDWSGASVWIYKHGARSGGAVPVAPANVLAH
jgi:hypothetical protein